MSIGPLRRVVGTAGLLAIVPTAVLLATNALTPVDAAVRAAATFGVVVILGRIAGWWLSATAASFERDLDDEPAPERRATDRPSGSGSDADVVAAQS